MTSSDLKDRAARLRRLASFTLDPKTREELDFLADEYEKAADRPSDFTVSTVFPD